MRLTIALQVTSRLISTSRLDWSDALRPRPRRGVLEVLAWSQFFISRIFCMKYEENKNKEFYWGWNWGFTYGIHYCVLIWGNACRNECVRWGPPVGNVVSSKWPTLSLSCCSGGSRIQTRISYCLGIAAHSHNLYVFSIWDYITCMAQIIW